MPTPPRTKTAPRHMPWTGLPSGVTFGRSWVGHLSPRHVRHSRTWASPTRPAARCAFALTSASSRPAAASAPPENLPVDCFVRSLDAPKPRDGSKGASLTAAACSRFDARMHGVPDVHLRTSRAGSSKATTQAAAAFWVVTSTSS